MMKSLFTAATGMEAQQTRIDVISNNLANMNTSGFKQSRAVFQDLLYETISEPGAESASGITTPSPFQVGSGTKVVSTPSSFTQGSLEQTGRALDIAIEGDGFLQVTTPQGEAYTRAGSLAVNSSGQLVTQTGFQVSPAISLSGFSNITIGQDGTVSGVADGSTTVSSIGQITLAQFSNNSGLKALGRNLYVETEASGTPSTTAPGENSSGTIRQGFLEGSNVNVAEELIGMVIAQRAFELNSKVIRTSDDILSAINQNT